MTQQAMDKTRATLEEMVNRLQYGEIVETGGKTYRLTGYVALTHPQNRPIGVRPVVDVLGPFGHIGREYPPAVLRRMADLMERLDAWEKGEGPWPESP